MAQRENTFASAARRPSLWARILFVLLLSGPPKFRLRNPDASLDYTVDWVILLQLLVWSIGGCWVIYNGHLLSGGNRSARWHFSTLDRLSLVLFVLLSTSVIFSEAPVFSAFKIYQLVVTFGFVTVFAKLFGLYELLNTLFAGCACLALADIIAAFTMPDLVFVVSEFGSMRFRGDLLAQTGEVSLVGLVLLLTIRSDLPKAKFGVWALVLGGVLVCSLARTSYLAVFLVVILASLRPPQIPVLRKLVVLLLMTLPLIFGALLNVLNTQRQAEDIWTLSDRVGLWAYIIDATFTQRPWFGLGYFAASRIYGPEYNPDLGTAHSAFVEVFAGGGLVAFSVFLYIWILLVKKTGQLYLSRRDRIGFAVVALFCAALFLNSMGGELQADTAGFAFWCVLAALPLLLDASSPDPAGQGESHAGHVVPTAAITLANS